MPGLVGSDFGIDSRIVAKAGMGSAQHLKRCPFKADCVEPGLHVPSPKIVPSDRGLGILRREYLRLRLITYEFHPFLEASGRLGGIATMRVEL